MEKDFGCLMGLFFFPLKSFKFIFFIKLPRYVDYVARNATPNYFTKVVLLQIQADGSCL